MTKPNAWMPLYWGDYARDTGHLNATAHGAYLMLIKHYWCTGAPLDDDDDVLWRIACCDSPAEWQKVRRKIEPFFRIEGGRWHHKRIDAELRKATELTNARSEAGKRTAEKRWGKPSDRPGNGSEGIAEPIAELQDSYLLRGRPSQSQSQSQSPSPSSSPPSSPPPSRSEEEAHASRERALARGSQFAQFWKWYPRKVGKARARAAFEVALTKTDFATILRGVQELYEHQDQLCRDDGGDATPYPQNWLNDERWNDDYES